jgi:hypothetical protein
MATERRPVFAHATTGTPWLQIGRVILEGRTARIPLKVPNVPACPGEHLQGKVQVTSNGGQRFLVEVSLAISGRMSVRVHQMAEAAVLDMDQVLAAVPVLTTADVISETETIPEVLPVTEESPAIRRGRDEILEVFPIPADGGRGGHRGGGHRGRGGDDDDFDRKVSRIQERSPVGAVKHLLPLAVLALLLFVVVVHDLWVIFFGQPAASKNGGEPALVDPDPYIPIRFNDAPKQKNDKMPEPTMRFGLVMLREKDPKQPDRLKRLTFDEWGRTNNTVVRVDGKEFLFGQPPGTWIEMKGKLEGERAGRPRDGLSSSWWLPDSRIKVTQEVEIVPGEQSHRLDTCLVRYTVENRDTRDHRVGIRFLLDTYIGANDGVPFIIPGESGLCDSMKRFDGPKAVPDFIQAQEKGDLREPGTVAYLQFRIGENIESPEKVTLGGWPNAELRQFNYPSAMSQLTMWDVPFLSMKDLDGFARRIGKRAAYDSAVTMYWEERPLAPNKSRLVGFTYGLGNVDTAESEGHLLLTVGGRLVRKGEFTLTALVHRPAADEKLTLKPPPGFTILEGGATQTVPPVPAGATRPDSPVTWRIRAGEDGKYDLSVESNKGAKQKKTITIRTRGVFD